VEHSESFRCLSADYLKGIPGAVSSDEEQAIVVIDDPDSVGNCVTNVGIRDAMFPC
jgi:hypothetical protein